MDARMDTDPEGTGPAPAAAVPGQVTSDWVKDDIETLIRLLRVHSPE